MRVPDEGTSVYNNNNSNECNFSDSMEKNVMDSEDLPMLTNLSVNEYVEEIFFPRSLRR